jgi:hypothetical protein
MADPTVPDSQPLNDATIADDALRHLLSSLTGGVVGPYPVAERNNSPSPDFGIDWNMMEANNEGNLSLSADQEAVASLSLAILERFDELPMSDDEVDERSDEETELPDEPEVAGMRSIVLSLSCTYLNIILFLRLAVAEPGAEDEEAHSRKRARTKDPVTTSRFWYPWPDRIVSLLISAAYMSE